TVAMENQVRSALKTQLEEGWYQFSDVKYDQPGSRFARGARAFEAAEGLDRTRTEARVGRLCCALADNGFAYAARIMERIVNYDILELQQNPFAADFKLQAHLSSTPDLVDIVKQWSDRMTVSPDAKAVYAFILWHLDRRAEAQSVAADLARTWPDSSMTVLVRLMRSPDDPAASATPGTVP
ncbi:MAG TPA: hypothetical protein VGM03_14035, partial [Phycisphaerae bacterium]